MAAMNTRDDDQLRSNHSLQQQWRSHDGTALLTARVATRQAPMCSRTLHRYDCGRDLLL